MHIHDSNTLPIFTQSWISEHQLLYYNGVWKFRLQCFIFGVKFARRKTVTCGWNFGCWIGKLWSICMVSVLEGGCVYWSNVRWKLQQNRTINENLQVPQTKLHIKSWKLERMSPTQPKPFEKHPGKVFHWTFRVIIDLMAISRHLKTFCWLDTPIVISTHFNSSFGGILPFFCRIESL